MTALNPPSEAYLQHYGVLGMKWGVRNAESKERLRSSNKEISKNKAVAKAAGITKNYPSQAKALSNVEKLKAEKKAIRRQDRIEQGNERLENSDGSVVKANLKSVGKYLGVNFLANYGVQAVGTITGSKEITAGAAVVSNILTTAYLVRNINDVVNVNTANNARLAKLVEDEKNS